MKIVMPGGSGLLGSLLSSNFVNRGDEVVILSRPHRTEADNVDPDSQIRTIAWDGKNPGAWCHEIDGADVVINLAGRSVNCRLNSGNRRQIMDSRIDSTRAIGRAIQSAKTPPKVWLQSGTATLYPHTFGRPNTESSQVDTGDGMPSTWKFSIEVAKAWESAATNFELHSTRQVLMRISLVMSPDAQSVFDVLMGLVRKRLGGRNGSGKQFVSWIHHRDFVRAVDCLINSPEFRGPVNLASPFPLCNSEFMAEIRNFAGIRFGLPAPKWLLELGAVFMKTETELILKSRRVVPEKLLNSGFQFEFPQWHQAVADIGSAYEDRRSSR